MNYLGLPGFGDVETWPPCYGHPLDPRTPEPDRREDEDEDGNEDDEDEMEPDDETLEASYEQAHNEQRRLSNGNFTG